MPDRGQRHDCPHCKAKFYDLGRAPVCPNCSKIPALSPTDQPGRMQQIVIKNRKVDKGRTKGSVEPGETDSELCLVGKVQKSGDGKEYFLTTLSGSQRRITNAVPPEWDGKYVLLSGKLSGSNQSKTVTWTCSMKLLRFPINGLKKFLASRHFDHVGPRTVSDLVGVHGDKIFLVLFQGKDALKDGCQISDQLAENICAKWRELSSSRDLHVCLRDAEGEGLGDHFSDRVVKEFGSETVEVLGSDPRKIIERISGFGLERLISLCQSLGTLDRFEAEMELRLEHILGRSERVEGDTCAPVQKGQGVRRQGVVEQLVVSSRHDEDEVSAWIGSDAFEKNFVRVMANGQECVARRTTYGLEERLSKELKRISNAKSGIKLRGDGDPKGFSDALGNRINLDSDQRHAVKAVLQQTVTLVTGGPGSGKTTLVKALLDQLVKAGVESEEYCLMAPTGLAAKRLMDSTAKKATTIHSKLQLFAGKEVADSGKELKEKVVIVDECSMLTTELCLHIVSNVGDGAHLILIGDFNQLPPIGLGQPYRDLIESQKFSVEWLTGNHRQGAESDIAIASRAVLERTLPPNRKSEGFEFIEERTEEKIRERVISLYNKYSSSEKDGSRDQSLAQILTPMNKKGLGKFVLNALVQEKLKTSDGSPIGGTENISGKDESIYLHDRVIFTENNRDLSLVNGDIGTITKTSSQTPKGLSVTVEFDAGERDLDKVQLRKLEPAYALTIHKAQGSEFETVIIPVSEGHRFMLRRNLLYTAITRGKRKVILVGDLNAFLIGIKSDLGSFRYTGLSEILAMEV